MWTFFFVFYSPTCSSAGWYTSNFPAELEQKKKDNPMSIETHTASSVPPPSLPASNVISPTRFAIQSGKNPPNHHRKTAKTNQKGIPKGKSQWLSPAPSWVREARGFVQITAPPPNSKLIAQLAPPSLLRLLFSLDWGSFLWPGLRRVCIAWHLHDAVNRV